MGRVRAIRLALAVIIAIDTVPATPYAQSRPLVAAAAAPFYHRLLVQIERIKIFDHHAHPAFADDPDVDAMAIPPSSSPLRSREDNPELAAAARALFGYPFADLAPPHAKWLVDKKTQLKRQYPGQAYFNYVLDRIGIDSSIANRVAMADYLDPARFKWVFFVDCFMFPFDNSALAARNPDQAVFMPMQAKVLARYQRQAALDNLPPTLDGYLAFVTRVLTDNRTRGAIAVKFEAAYFRPLAFTDPPRDRASDIYDRYRAGGVPPPSDYEAFEDFVFRYLLVEAGRLHLAVHIHSSNGAGDYFSVRGVNVLNLEPVLRDPRYLSTTFVLIHGGYPFDREAIWLASMKNVFLDCSGIAVQLYPTELKDILRRWLEAFPEKVTFGSDAFPYGTALGVEESYWLAVRTSRTALAAALAEMIAAREITESVAMTFARGYLHDNAARLYGSAAK